MTVKDVFDLRRQGRIEEAYEAIRPMYAAHKGRYTTLCMFWTAADVFKLRLEQGRTEEAEKILEALKRMLPRVEAINKELDSKYTQAPTTEPKLPWEYNDKKQSSTSAAGFIASAVHRLAKVEQKSLKARKETPSGEIGDIRDACVPEEEPKAEIRVGSSDLCSQEKEPPSDEDLSGHLAVSLDEGIIRPIEGINAPQRIVLACLVAHPGYNVPQISASTGIPAKSIERHVAVLIDRGLIEHRDSKKTGGYYTVEK